jgi:LPXTG-motif cell wall-anchored protein
MSSARKRAGLTHLHACGARRRVTAVGLAALAGATFGAPLMLSTRAGAADDSSTTTTEISIPSTTDTVATTTTAPTTTAPSALPSTTTTAPAVSATTTAAPTTTIATVGGQGIVELGGDQTPVTLPTSRSDAAAAQLPRTGAAPTLPTLTGIALLIAGALASTTKRRRQMGASRIKSRRRS